MLNGMAEKHSEEGMKTDRTIIFYLLLLVIHVAHVFEEIGGRFWLIRRFPSFGSFLAVNWLLFCIPVAFFYFFLRRKKWAYIMSMVYAGIMVLNGLGHNLATIVTGKYFDGFAGGYSGIGLILIGLPLIYYLGNAPQSLKREPGKRCAS
jgi:hypothetical protein